MSRFLLARRAAGKSPATVEWYDARLRRIAGFLGDPIASAVTRDDLRRFLVTLKQGTAGRAAADSYVEQHRKAIAALYTWAIREGIATSSPAAGLDRFKGDRRLPAVYAGEQVRALVDAQPRLTTGHVTRSGLRNQTILLLMYDTGVRVGERRDHRRRC